MLILFCIYIDKICDSETLGVYNHQRLKTSDGPEDFLKGVALLTDEVGKLDLLLDGVPPGECEYYIILKLNYTFCHVSKLLIFLGLFNIVNYEMSFEHRSLSALDQNTFLK